MNYARLLFGSVLVILGGLFLLETMDVLDAGEVIGTWWPLVLIAAAALVYLANRGHWMTPLVLAVAGVLALLGTTDVIEDGVRIVWPALIILVGVSLLFGRSKPATEIDDRVTAFTAFGGTDVASHSKHFEGGNVGAVFGGAEIDLRDAELAPGASLDVFAAFGGAEIKVPEGWKVITHGLPLFGGFENITNKESLPADAPTLDVNATVLFGAVEVKH